MMTVRMRCLLLTVMTGVFTTRGSLAVKCHDYGITDGVNIDQTAECDGKTCFILGTITQRQTLGGVSINQTEGLERGCADEEDQREFGYNMGCIGIQVLQVISQVCMCNTDLCNVYLPAIYAPTNPVTCYICAAGADDDQSCRQELTDTERKNTCEGVACFVTAVSDITYVRGCIIGDAVRDPYCKDFSVSGIQSNYCQCETDYCNENENKAKTSVQNGGNRCASPPMYHVLLLLLGFIATFLFSTYHVA